MPNTPESVSLNEALKMLDPMNDDHWTADGQPRMEVLEAMTNGNLTRADVDVATSGAKRESSVFKIVTHPPEKLPQGDTLDIGNALAGAPPAEPQPAPAAEIDEGISEPVEYQVPVPGIFVDVFAPEKAEGQGAHDGGFGGDMEAVALVVKVNFDGSLNLKVFAPNGGDDQFLAGVQHRSVIVPKRGTADGNVAFWSWGID